MEGTGLLIRRLRMEQKRSQQALCKGICAVSYLSKIEKGTANPSNEIVSLLFARLGVDYRLDEAFLHDVRQMLDAYFDHFALMEEEQEEKQRLVAAREQALKSPLADAYTLFLAYEAFADHHNWADAKPLLDTLTGREAAMGERDLFFYSLARGETAKELADATVWYHKAIHLLPYSIAPFFLGAKLYQMGEYQESLVYVQQAYARATEEGNPYMLLYTSELTAGCYAELYQEEMMMRYYRQTRRLAQAIAPKMIAGIDYNIGATLVIMRKSAQGLPYLQRAKQGRYKADILLYHKLAIAYFDTGNRQEAVKALRKAEALLKAGKGTPMEEKLIRIVRFRLEKNYLQSEAYYRLLREVYDGIDKVYHHGFKQFHGNLLAEACVHSRRYKEALHIASEVRIFPEFIK
ncbi:MAG TPA: helix-turn-helix transcriptional regulator [Candidatus Limiplasma sp.]|nr:helix-turn-helix transcriptional regulator [Candidatus Limiplasma sp.]